ncbi:MAG: NADH-quinone oxidoreductase subunit A [Paludibacteraceae bacterium]|nr:NADH-quinone oxidoreductase subunit A [Paludibacteraceae bacterium]MBP5524817.1 NADH-quinone oxidoreductase subunit A [Paludibacteraceae bacterium]MCR5246248.1 NADH-quinone oxidoreductase subunit A [Paludibacteraceae bacterium]
MGSSEIFVVVMLTAVVMVVAAIVIGLLIAPKSKNAQKGEPYECGIPTRGTSWLQFRPGYYLFALLFLMFDVETVLLFPWATITKTLGPNGILAILFFLLILVLGLAYAWKKGALEWK